MPDGLQTRSLTLLGSTHPSLGVEPHGDLGARVHDGGYGPGVETIDTHPSKSSTRPGAALSPCCDSINICRHQGESTPHLGVRVHPCGPGCSGSGVGRGGDAPLVSIVLTKLAVELVLVVNATANLWISERGVNV